MSERDERPAPGGAAPGYTGGGTSDTGEITGAGGGAGTAGLVDVPAPHPQAPLPAGDDDPADL